jgi:hypothetical protein
VKIDIGGGSNPNIGYRNLDPVHGEGAWKIMAQESWPVEDNSVEAISASHVLEHIPAGQDRIDTFNNAWDALIPGGTLTIHVPLVGYTDNFNSPKVVNFWGAWADPTHISYWWFPESLYYFYGDHTLKANADYGIKFWNLGPCIVDLEVEEALSVDRGSWWSVIGGWEGVARLEKPGEIEIEIEIEHE